MKFDRIDLYVDLTYGALIVVGIVALMVLGPKMLAAATFSFGVILAYAVHVGWRMARFDPKVQDKIEETIDKRVGEMEDKVEETVEKAVEDEVGKNVAEQVGQMQAEVQEQVEETVEEAVNGE